MTPEPLGPFATGALVLFAIVFGTLLVIAIKDRLLGKLALREGVRRPGQTLLVVGGLMVGAAGITAASIGIDSARDSAVSNAYRSWDEIDLVVAAGDEPFPRSAADELRTALGDRVAGVQPAIERFGSLVNKTKKRSNSGVQLVSFDPATQEAFGTFVLTDGTTTTGEGLGKREVFVSRQLADDLDIEVGDELKMGVGPLTEPDPSPKDLAERLRDEAKRFKELQDDAEAAAIEAAERAGKRAGEQAAKQEAARITSALEAQGQAMADAYMAEIEDFQAGIEDTIERAENAEQELGLPPGSIPPFLSEPEVPEPPTFEAPDEGAIAAHVEAVAIAAGERAAQRAGQQVGRRWAPRLRRLGHKLERLQDELKEMVEDLKPPVLKVAGIAKAEGPGAFGLTAAVFAPLPLVQEMSNTDDITSIRLSGHGDERAGLADVTAELPAIREAVGSIAPSLDLGDEELKVNTVKADEVDSARDSAEFTVALLIAMSVLVLAAGVALVINLTQMLAEERRPRLAIMRAMGLSRGGLVKLSTLEGAFYSLLAAVVGTLVGIPAGRILAQRFGEAFAGFFGAEYDYRFVFSVRPRTLMISFVLGALITLLTVFISAIRTSRMSIPAAIRSLPEPARQRPKRVWVRRLAATAFLLLGLAGLGGPDPMGRLFAGVLVIAVGARMLRHHMPERLRGTLQGLALAGWAFFSVWQNSSMDDPNVFFGVFTVAVIIAVVGLAIAISANLRMVERIVTGFAGLFGSRVRAGLTPPLAYLSRRTGRTSLSIMMFAVVMAIISMSSVFLYVFEPNYEKDSLGYDIMLTNAEKDPTNIPEELRGEILERADIPVKVYTGRMETSFQNFEQIFAPLYYVTDEQFADPPFALSATDDDFANDEAALEAVRTDPTWVISAFGNPGDAIVVEKEDGTEVEYTIAAVPAAGMFQGIMGTEETFAGLDTQGRGWSSILAVAPGSDPATVAAAIERRKYNDGVDTQLILEEMEKVYRANRTFFSVIDILMRMGLVVGILSLGILGLRAIIERRHLIGVLRAMGFFRRTVMSGLLVEAFSTTILGVLVGCLTGIVMGYIFFLSFFERATFGLDPEDLRSAIILVFIAVFLVTLGPAWRASRLPPAEAVRYTE